MKTSNILILLILIFNTIPIQGNAKNINLNQESPFIKILTDSLVYDAGTPALFIVSSNMDNKVNFEINFINTTIYSEQFLNLSQAPQQYLWNVEPHSYCGIYSAYAYFEDTPTIFDQTEVEVKQDTELCTFGDPTKFQVLKLNITAVGNKREINNYHVFFENMWTEEKNQIEDVKRRAIVEEFDDSILFKEGHAIRIKVRSVDREWEGETVIAAHQGMNDVIVAVNRTPSFWDKVTGIVAASAIIIVITLMLIKDLRERRKPRIRGRPTEIDKETFDPTRPDELL